MTPIARTLLDFYQLVKEIAETESISMDAAALEAAVLWEHINEAPAPATEVTVVHPESSLTITA